MAIKINKQINPRALLPQIRRLFELSSHQILDLEKTWDISHGTPVLTLGGQYATRGWTERTQGYQFGYAILQFDATGEKKLLALGRERTLQRMASHVSHVGVHDHGFNNISTYGNLLRLIGEGGIEENEYERAF